MGCTIVPSVITGQTYSAGNYNTYVKDNINSLLVFTTAGDLVYASSSTTLARLGIGTEGYVLTVVSGLPVWATSVPIGVVTSWAGSSVPTNWLDCDGSLKSKSTYAALYAILGTIWGAGDASNFNLPDLRGQTIIGVGTGSGLTPRALAASVGTETHQLTSAEMPSHTHVQNSHTHTVPSPDRAANSGSAFDVFDTPGSSWTSGATTATNQNTGGDGAHNNMQPSRALRYIIKAL